MEKEKPNRSVSEVPTELENRKRSVMELVLNSADEKLARIEDPADRRTARTVFEETFRRLFAAAKEENRLKAVRIIDPSAPEPEAPAFRGLSVKKDRSRSR